MCHCSDVLPTHVLQPRRSGLLVVSVVAIVSLRCYGAALAGSMATCQGHMGPCSVRQAGYETDTSVSITRSRAIAWQTTNTSYTCDRYKCFPGYKCFSVPPAMTWQLKYVASGGPGKRRHGNRSKHACASVALAGTSTSSEVTRRFHMQQFRSRWVTRALSLATVSHRSPSVPGMVPSCFPWSSGTCVE